MHLYTPTHMHLYTYPPYPAHTSSTVVVRMACSLMHWVWCAVHCLQHQGYVGEAVLPTHCVVMDTWWGCICYMCAGVGVDA